MLFHYAVTLIETYLLKSYLCSVSLNIDPAPKSIQSKIVYLIEQDSKGLTAEQALKKT